MLIGITGIQRRTEDHSIELVKQRLDCTYKIAHTTIVRTMNNFVRTKRERNLFGSFSEEIFRVEDALDVRVMLAESFPEVQ